MRYTEYHSEQQKGQPLLQEGLEEGGQWGDHRRSTRRRVKPMEFWRNERPVYEVQTMEVRALLVGGCVCLCDGVCLRAWRCLGWGGETVLCGVGGGNGERDMVASVYHAYSHSYPHPHSDGHDGGWTQHSH